MPRRSVAGSCNHEMRGAQKPFLEGSPASARAGRTEMAVDIHQTISLFQEA